MEEFRKFPLQRGRTLDRHKEWDIGSDDYKLILWLKVWLFQASFY